MTLQTEPEVRTRLHGSMTAHMRAAALRADVPKVLRLGVVRAGRIVEERVFRAPAAVTIGADENATVVVDDRWPGERPLLTPVAATPSHGYRLDVPPGASGRIATDAGIVELGVTRSVLLGSDARGRLTLGDVTLLFQFVPAPLPPARPQLPLGVRAQLVDSIDWNLVVLCALSFLVHFGFVGAMLSDWMDPPVADDVASARTVAALVDDTRVLPATVVEPMAQPSAAGPAAHDAAPTSARGEHTTSRRAPASGASSAPSSTERDAAALAGRAEQMRIDLLNAYGQSAAVSRALDARDVPVADLSQAAQSEHGATTGGDSLVVGSIRGGVVGPDAHRGGLDALATREGTASDRAGTERVTTGPRASTEIGRVESSAPMNDAERVVARLRTRFRRCYERGLASEPSLAGAVTIVAKIAANGDVVSATPDAASTLGPTVTACLASVVEHAAFAPPGGGGSTLRIPIKFVQQAR